MTVTSTSPGPTRVPEEGAPVGIVFTIGHATRPLEEFIGLLQAHGVTFLADVRTIPRSRHNPQFNRDTLPESLAGAGIVYGHMPALGGLRHTRPGSPNAGWRNASFRGFADYMQTPEFVAGLGELMDLARAERVAIMCAETVPWRCHRSLIADALTVRSVAVEHIIGAGRAQPHHLTPFAHVEGTEITYPAVPETQPQADRGSKPHMPRSRRSRQASSKMAASMPLRSTSEVRGE